MKYIDLKQAPAGMKKNTEKKGKLSYFVMGFVGLVLFTGAGLFIYGLKGGGKNQTVEGKVQTVNLKQDDGRINVLIVGKDSRSSGVVTSVLTDTIIVASVGKLNGDVVLISLPRDLWVKHPEGGYNKINAIYALSQDGKELENLSQVVHEVLGIPVHYYATVDFNLFKETIDVLGGIEVNVETAFKDYEYPVEGKEASTCGISPDELKKLTEKDSIYKSCLESGSMCVQAFPCRYETLSFATGVQTMNGETALKFARSRHGTNNEGSDFARAKRQQKIIMAVKDKALSANILLNPLKIKDLYDTYNKNIDTNIDLGVIQNFILLSQQVNIANFRSIVLDTGDTAETGGLLYSPIDRTLYNGAYVLIPRSGDFSQIHAYVSQYLFGE